MRKAYIRITSIILITIMLLSMTLTAFAEEPSNIDTQQTTENNATKDVKSVADTDFKTSDDTFAEEDVPKEVEEQLLAQFNGENTSSDNSQMVISQTSINSKFLVSDKDVPESSGLDDAKDLEKEEPETIPEEDVFKLDNVKIVNDTISTTLYDGTTISISGRMPKDAVVEATEVFDTDSLSVDEDLSIIKAYDIKILSNGEYFQPEDIDSEVRVSIKLDDLKEAVAETVDETVPVNEETITLLHIDDEDNVSEVENIDITEDTVSFDADSFSVYVLATDGKYSEITTTMTSSKVVGSASSEEELSTTVTFTVDSNTPYNNITKHLDFIGNMYEYVGYEFPSGQSASAVTVSNATDFGCDVSLNFNEITHDQALLASLKEQLAQKEVELQEAKDAVELGTPIYVHTSNLDDNGNYLDASSNSTRRYSKGVHGNAPEAIKTITIPEATALKVVLIYGFYDSYDWVGICEGEFIDENGVIDDYTTSTNFKNWRTNHPEIIGLHTGNQWNPIKSNSIDIVFGNTVSFLFRSVSWTSGGYGYYAKVYDASAVAAKQAEIDALQNQISAIEGDDLSLSLILKFKNLTEFTEEDKQSKKIETTTPLQSQIDDIQSQINTLNEQKTSLTEQKNTLNAAIDVLKAQYRTTLNDYIASNPDKVSGGIRYSHTPNIDDAGIQNGNYANSFKKTEVVTIPGAESLHVVITYGGESANYDWVCMWEGDNSEYTAANDYGTSVTDKLGGGNHTATSNTKEYDVTGDAVTFAFKSDSSGVGDGYGYYAIVSNYHQFNEEAQQYVSQLQTQLEIDIAALTAQISDLDAQISFITSQINTLNAQKTNLANQKNEIITCFDNFTFEKESFVTIKDNKTNSIEGNETAKIMLSWKDSNIPDGVIVSLNWTTTELDEYGNRKKNLSLVCTERAELNLSYTCSIATVSGEGQSGEYDPGMFKLELPYYAFSDSFKGRRAYGYYALSDHNLRDYDKNYDNYAPKPVLGIKNTSNEVLKYTIDKANNKIIITNQKK